MCSLSSARRQSARLSTSLAMGPATVIPEQRGWKEADMLHPFCSGDPHCLASEGGTQGHDQGKVKRPWGHLGSGVENEWSWQTSSNNLLALRESLLWGRTLGDQQAR